METLRCHNVTISQVNDLSSRVVDNDAVILVISPAVSPPQSIAEFIADAINLDSALGKNTAVLKCSTVSGSRLVLSPTEPITPYDDVKVLYEAARAGLQRAVDAGAKRPIIVLQKFPKWPLSELVILLAALEKLYVPLQIRESFPALIPSLQSLCVYSEESDVNPTALNDLIKQAVSIEISRGLVRDIGGSDPERMTPRAVAELLTNEFTNTRVSVRVIDNSDVIDREYPLLAAVDRAARVIPRHKGCVIILEYVPAKYEKTIMLVGKGVTFDTGGADVKINGSMSGMSRDKCGAAAVAGFVKACEILHAEVKVVAALGMVRNSIGENAYVADELLRSRSGLSVRIGNTDAEGRMVMADLLYEMAVRATSERKPHIYTVATLTGHAERSVGNYTIVMDNHVAREMDHARQFASCADEVADPCEISVIRRDDMRQHKGQCPGDQILQAESKPSTAVRRGHQGPAAFLMMVSALDQGSIPYTHLDIAGSAGDYPAPPTASPMLALLAAHGLIARP